MRSTRAALALAPLLAALPALAVAATSSIPADLVEPKTIKLDGVPKEWPAMTSLDVAVKGTPKKGDLEAKAGVAYDATNLYVGADVTDDVLKGGGAGDKVVFSLQFPGGSPIEIHVAPGEPGKSAASVKKADGGAVTGAKAVEAPRQGGWSIEAQIPWSTFPDAAKTRVGLRAGLFVHDADQGAVDAIVGNAQSNALPAMPNEAEQGVQAGIVKEKKLRATPAFDVVADLVGSDGMKERAMVFDRWLVVLGPTFRKGSEYYFGDLDTDTIKSVEAKDLTGDGKDELVVRKRIGTATKYREVYEVHAWLSGETPTAVFRHEVGIVAETGSLENAVKLEADGKKTAIKIEAQPAKAWNAGNYKEPMEKSWSPALLPWGSVKSRTFKFDGSGFKPSSEEKQAPTPPPAPDPGKKVPDPPKPPPGPSPTELAKQVYEAFKKSKSITGAAHFDLAADVEGSSELERVVLHDKELVVFGKGYRGGTGWSSVTLAQFAQGSDVKEITTKDVTGDGKAEIVVRGTVSAKVRTAEGDGTAVREILLVFQVEAQGIKRIFGAELSRAMGAKKVSGTFTLGAKEIELGPGRAVDWTEKTYPFQQDSGPVGGLEPLLLPWGGNKAVKYKWSGSAFTK